MANGARMVSNKVVHQIAWWCQGHTLETDMKVLDLDVYDAILGFDWLKPYNPMNCHWDNRTIEFENKGKLIKLQGVYHQQRLYLKSQLIHF